MARGETMKQALNRDNESITEPTLIDGMRPETRSHYTLTFENPWVTGGTGIAKLLLTPSEVRKHAQVLANTFGTRVVASRTGFSFDTEPESVTNPYYGIRYPVSHFETKFEEINSLKQARYQAQEVANDRQIPVYIEHLRGGKWVAIETVYEELELEV